MCVCFCVLLTSNHDCLADGSDVMFNKFNLNASQPQNATTSDLTSSDLSCVVAENGLWKLSDCNELHGVVCQSEEQLPGTDTVSYIYSPSNFSLLAICRPSGCTVESGVVGIVGVVVVGVCITALR